MRPSAIPHTFLDRSEAGRLLAERLAPLRSERPVVLALPRGGVPVGAEVARALRAPLDILLVRKLGLPFQPEVAFGAIGEEDVRVLNTELIQRIGLSDAQIAEVEDRERVELARRGEQYRGDRTPIELAGRSVVIVDDGLATGATARVAIEIARVRRARKITVAVPVASPVVVAELATLADDVVSLLAPTAFRAVGQWYDDFEPTTDEEVTSILNASVDRESDAGAQ